MHVLIDIPHPKVLFIAGLWPIFMLGLKSWPMTRSFKFLCGFVIVLFGDSCIDRIEADVDAVDVGILVVDGLITDQPGPYTVKIFRAFAADENLQNEVPFPVRRVTIMDDLGREGGFDLRRQWYFYYKT